MYLTPELRERFAHELRTRRDALVSEAQEGAERTRSAAKQQLEESVGDASDRATALVLSSLQSAELSRDLRELREVESALTRLEEGSYGECADCGGEIALARLNASPTAQRCIACQSVHEKTHAAPGRPPP